MSGKYTSTIDRPETPPSAADRGRSRLGDLSRPIRIDRRITHNRRSNMVLALVAVMIASALAAAIFVLPVKTMFDQDDQIAERTDQLAEMQTVNNELRGEVARLKTDDGIKEAAREQLGFVEPDEIRQSIVDLPPVPTDLPDGWPYSVISGIVAIRTNPPAPDTTSAPTTPASSAPPAPTVEPASLPSGTVPATGPPATTAPPAP
jgi:cell division protein FtsB